MNRFNEILGNSADIVYLSSKDVKIKVFIKFKTDLEGRELFFSYDDILDIKERFSKSPLSEIGGFITYDDDDEILLISFDNILEVKFDKEEFEILKKLNDLDNQIKIIVKMQFEKNYENELRSLIRDKKTLINQLNKK